MASSWQPLATGTQRGPVEHWPGRQARRPPHRGRLATASESKTVDLHDYLRVVRKRWRTITAATLLMVALAALYTLTSPKVYEAHTQLFVSTSGGSGHHRSCCRATPSPSSG